MSILSGSRNHSKLIAVLALLLTVNSARAQTTTFTYQGRLTDNGTAANGNYDFQFKLFDGGGAQIGSPLTRSTVLVANGIFTVQLDFGASAFPGADRFLEIGVKLSSGGSFTTLSPRQQITAASYGVRTLSAANADNATNATQLGGVAANQYVLASDSRLSDSRAPTAGSSNYVQNTSTQQTGSNFNISGNGTAGGILTGLVVRATNGFNIGADRVLSIAGTGNTFTGANNGIFNTGTSNSFFGSSAGAHNTAGDTNAFFGAGAGFLNSMGVANSYFGAGAGQNSTGSSNAFFGTVAGQLNTADFNAFFGSGAGSQNTTGNGNAFFGANAGSVNTNGSSNSFFGIFAGEHNTADNNSFFGSFAGNANVGGTNNAFFGANAGTANKTGFSNSFFGKSAGAANIAGNGNAFFGNFAGASNLASSNSFFGSDAGVDNSTGTGNSFFGWGAGFSNTIADSSSLFGAAAGIRSTACCNSFFGNSAGLNNTTGKSNAFFGTGAGSQNTMGEYNAFFGDSSGLSNTAETNNTFIGAFSNGAASITNATAIGFRASVAQSNSLVLGGINGVNAATADTKVGIGTTVPSARLDLVAGDTQLRFGNSMNDDGGYLVSTTSTQAILSGGGRQVGGGWVAKGSGAALLEARLGSIHFYTNDGLAAGGSFTPAERMTITPNGNVGIAAPAPNAKLQVAAGDVYVQTQGKGIILRATDGANCFRVTVNNVGALSTAPVLCP